MNNDWKNDAGYLERLADIRARGIDALVAMHWESREHYALSESPIEDLMEEALLLVEVDQLYFTERRRPVTSPTLQLYNSKMLKDWKADVYPDVHEYGVVCQQAQIETYRVDFLIILKLDGRGPYRIVVECDGHAFHERTQEQAERDKSRDRALTVLGCTVVRFTGREIWRDALSCAREVVRVIDRIENDTRPPL